jgi:hypothetical protein
MFNPRIEDVRRMAHYCANVNTFPQLCVNMPSSMHYSMKEDD